MRNQYPNHSIKKIRLDNAKEYRSALFTNFCDSLGIRLEYCVSYLHSQNGLAEANLKRIQGVAQPILAQSNLPSECWSHAAEHAVAILNVRPFAKKPSAHTQQNGEPASCSHFRTWGCAVYVTIPSINRESKLSARRKLGIYVGIQSPSIIKYLDIEKGQTHFARFAD